MCLSITQGEHVPSIMNLQKIAKVIATGGRSIGTSRSMLVGISGIDASGKGFVSKKLARMLKADGWNVALINVDGWLNLPPARFSAIDQGRHFYAHALRLDEMLGRLALPLRDNRSVNLIADFAEEIAAEYRKHNYNFNNIDIILLEGIFLFKKEYREHFDLKIWVECSFDTALRRAIGRSQEGLTAEETVKVYETIYFPAQRIHFDTDRPVEFADLIIRNDQRR